MSKMNGRKLNDVLAYHGAILVPELKKTPNLGSTCHRWRGGMIQFFRDQNNFDPEDPRFETWIVGYVLHHDMK